MNLGKFKYPGFYPCVYNNFQVLSFVLFLLKFLPVSVTGPHRESGYADKSIAKNAWTLVRHASANEGTLGRDPLMQRERDLIKGNNAL